MKKIFLFLISLFIGIGIFLWIGKIVGWSEIGSAFLLFTGTHGIIIFTLTFIVILIGNRKWQEILRAQDVKISFFELLKAFLAGFSVMFLAPVLVWAGEILRGYVIRRKNKVSWSKIMASVFIDRVLEWTINLIVIVLGSFYFLYKIGLPSKNLLMIFGGVFLIFFSAIAYFYFKISKKESIVKFLFKITGFKKHSKNNLFFEAEKEIFDFFKWQNKFMQKSFLLSFLRAGVMCLRAWVLVLFLGKNIEVLSAFSLLGFTYLAAMIPIPTALGSHEAIQTFAFKSLGLTLSSATAFTMIIRGAELLVALLGIMMVLRVGIGFFKNIFFKEVEEAGEFITENDV
ncbi:MAG: flippase-like domain-containing protein [Patescibacteria group bacterium]|nr:flippase-like domain-containing protein [Patescibacteria group bacterium]